MPRHHLRHFYDATEPHNIPAGSLAAVYVNTDGSFAWTQEEVNRMHGVFGISESRDPDFAQYARCIAIEPGAGEPQDVVNFLRVRRLYGHRDGMAYVNLSNWEETERTVNQAGEDCDWWVAHPGDAHPQALQSPLKGKSPLAVQTFWGNAYDMSVILGKLVFTPAHEFKATGR